MFRLLSTTTARFTAIATLTAISAFMVFTGVNALASDGQCGPWMKTDRTCVFGEYNTAWRWVRDCSNSTDACMPRHFDKQQICDSEDICLPTKRGSNRPLDPNYDMGTCTPWEKVNGVSCSDDDGNLISGKWIRACKLVGIPTEDCSRTRPEDYIED